MRFSEQWLREWVDPPVSTDELVVQLTAAGLEVDSVEPTAAPLAGVVVGKVLSVSPHPNADKLRICRVDVGDESPLSIVCGAPNVREGLLAPLARVGARLPEGLEIKPAQIRGHDSQGMLCSARELGLSDAAEGLMELPGGADPGVDFYEYLGLADVSIEIDLTPNRGDCLGVAGVAREVGVLNRCPVSGPPMKPVPETIPDVFPVVLESPADCPRYVGRVIRNVSPNADTPLWMQERLRRSGLRSISPVVDVTNYVMLELGQPMHAFDLDKLEDSVRVRRAAEGESLALLDGTRVDLHPATLVIADGNRPVAMAGIMGGADTAVTEETRHIFLESAFFSPRQLSGEARRYALHTDSSHRFERGVDWDLQRRAAERATALLLEIVGGEPGPAIEQVSEADLPRAEPIELRAARVRRLLGNAVPRDIVTDVLVRLGMQVDANGDSWKVKAPSFRFDVAIEADLVEEIARITGYDAIPSSRPRLPLEVKSEGEAAVPLARMRQVLVERGYREAITYSFVDPALESLIGSASSRLALANPISSDMAVMRTTLLPGLLQAVQRNMRRQQARVRLFEAGLVFGKTEDGTMQERVLSGVAAGPVLPEQWGTATRQTDFFDLKSDVEAVLRLTGWGDECRFSRAQLSYLHPGQSARIERDGRELGWLGALHPRIPRELKLAVPVFAFALNLDEAQAGLLPKYEPLSKFPSMRRDIAVVVDVDVSAEMVRECIGQIGINVLKNLELFDDYRGEGIDSGKKSLAFALTFQVPSRTLNDAEVDALVAEVTTALSDRFGAVLRA